MHRLLHTQSGRQVCIQSLDATQVDIGDIAHGLSYTCRFSGQVGEFYSVAEHSVRLSFAVPAPFQLWGLLHDSAEAYVGDLPAPVKCLLPEFQKLEERILGTIVTAFGLNMPMPPAVRHADQQLLCTELPVLVGSVSKAGRSEFDCLSPPLAKQRFLRRFEELAPTIDHHVQEPHQTT